MITLFERIPVCGPGVREWIKNIGKEKKMDKESYRAGGLRKPVPTLIKIQIA
jgi:hypothetical protein